MLRRPGQKDLNWYAYATCCAWKSTTSLILLPKKKFERLIFRAAIDKGSPPDFFLAGAAIIPVLARSGENERNKILVTFLYREALRNIRKYKLPGSAEGHGMSWRHPRSGTDL